MRFKVFILFSFLLSNQYLFGQNKLDSLIGTWVIVKFHGPFLDTLIDKGGDGCTGFLKLRIDKSHNVRYIFTNKRDSSIHNTGRIKLTKDKKIKISNNIHEIVYLDSLEKCMTMFLRMEIKGSLHRTFNFSIVDNILTFYYDFPRNPSKIRTLVFMREQY